jgi:hypothetical protein
VATPSRVDRAISLGLVFGLPCGGVEDLPAPRRCALRRARVAPQVQGLVRGAVIGLRNRENAVTEPAHLSARLARANQLLPVLVRGPRRPVCRGAQPRRVASLGEPPRWRASFCCEPAFVPREFCCRCVRARELAGRTHARHGHGLATGGVPRAGAPRRVTRVTAFPGQLAFGPCAILAGERACPVGPKRTRARAQGAAATDDGG